MAYYLCKTDPEILRYKDLLDQKELEWVGVVNPAALEMLRAMCPGDEWIVFHAGREGKAVGTAKVVSVTANGHGAPVVRIEAGERFQKPKSQDEILDEPIFDDSPLVTMGRMPVVALTPEQWDWFVGQAEEENPSEPAESGSSRQLLRALRRGQARGN